MTRGQIYRALARRYGYSPQVIADMTPAQQAMMLEDNENDPYADSITFRDQAEYLAWKAKQNGR